LQGLVVAELGASMIYENCLSMEVLRWEVEVSRIVKAFEEVSRRQVRMLVS
jgi:hypothetical protein